MTMRFRPRSLLLFPFAALALAAWLWAVTPAATPSPNLAADLPPGALMTIESTDFSTLLSTWTHSSEQRAWLGSASYSAFANSRLFGRLAEAQSGFAGAARLPVDASLLQQVAGKESVFAWYNIGNLEFLYITHLSHAQTASIPLLQQRTNFVRRESAGTPFYVRTATESTEPSTADNAGNAVPVAQDAASSADLNQPRTVAFALRGDWLLLATREDLLANALQLMASNHGAQAFANSQAEVGWFAAASAAGPAKHGELHMLLDLQSLTRTPQFRSYWIQRNVTDTRRFRAAVVDLYREPHRLREERVLLPMEPAAPPEQPDLGQLQALVPPRIGVSRAVAKPAPDLMLTTLEEKLLNSSTSAHHIANYAPAPATAGPVAGSANDLDLRIDAGTAPAEAPGDSLATLRRVLDTAQVQGMLTMDRSGLLGPDLPFLRVQSAVLLRSAMPWDRNTLSQALSTALRPLLTTGSLGLKWQGSSLDPSCLALSGVQPLTMCTQGPLAILSNDPTLLAEILSRRQTQVTSQPAQFLATIQPSEERANFRRITNQLGPHATGFEGSTPEASIQLFRDNLPSLADSFSDLASEHIVLRDEGAVVRQTVIYDWTASSDSPR